MMWHIPMVALLSNLISKGVSQSGTHLGRHIVWFLFCHTTVLLAQNNKSNGLGTHASFMHECPSRSFSPDKERTTRGVTLVGRSSGKEHVTPTSSFPLHRAFRNQVWKQCHHRNASTTSLWDFRLVSYFQGVENSRYVLLPNSFYVNVTFKTLLILQITTFTKKKSSSFLFWF